MKEDTLQELPIKIGFDNERRLGIEYFLNKCSIKYQNNDIKHMKFNVDDRAMHNIKEYSMCYNKKYPEFKETCGVCFAFCHWYTAKIYSFEETVKEIINEANKEPSIHKVGWFGNIYTPDKSVVEHNTRPLLKKIGDENPHLFDIQQIYSSNESNFISLPNLTKYKFLIDIGGNGYSGRVKFLLFTKRPLLLVDRNYVEYFYDDLIPFKHYIPVKMDLSNLLEMVEWTQNNYTKSLEIAMNAFEFAIKNFTLDKLLDRVYYVYNNINNMK